MSDYNSVIRPSTQDEQKHFREVGKKGVKNKTYTEMKQLEIRELEKEYHAKKIPFDRYSALLDLQDAVDSFVKEYQRRVGSTKDLNAALTKEDIFPTKTLDEYAGKKRFELADSKKLWEEKLVDNVKQNVQERMEVTWVAPRGNKVTFQMFNQEYYDIFPKQKPKEADKPASN